jgi:hypothetical protein
VLRFRAELNLRGSGHFLDLPFDPREALGEARPAVRGSVNGTPFRARISTYGGEFMLLLNREIREAAGIGPGDTVDVELERDTEPRTVEVPNDLAAALDDEARAAFDRMSYTHRREYVDWITEAKRPETRERRVAKAVELIREGRQQR